MLAPCGSRRTPSATASRTTVAHLVDVGGSEHERGVAALATGRLLEAGDVVDAGNEHVGDRGEALCENLRLHAAVLAPRPPRR